RRSLKLLEGGSLALFGALALAARVPAIQLSVAGVRLAVDGGLFALVTLSLLIGRPFTLQYAKEQVAPGILATPLFRRVNVEITAVWALAFAVMVAADAALAFLPGFTAVMAGAAIVAAMAGAAFFTAWRPKAVARRALKASAG